MQKPITRGTLFAWSAALTLVALFVLAVWPVPHKYPWGIPIAAAGTLVLCGLRSRSGDDFGAFLLGFTALGGLATWTLSSWLHLSDESAIVVWIALTAVPVAWLITLVRGNPTGLRPTINSR